MIGESKVGLDSWSPDDEVSDGFRCPFGESGGDKGENEEVNEFSGRGVKSDCMNVVVGAEDMDWGLYCSSSVG